MPAKYSLTSGAVRKLKGLLRDSRIGGAGASSSGGLAVETAFAQPFTVTWAASANNGDGCWIIWLPSSNCLYAKVAWVDVSSGLTAVGGDYPSGWYQLPDSISASQGGIVYLNVNVSGTTASAAFGPSAGTAPTIAIPIAALSVDSDNGVRTVRQNVNSAIMIADGSGSEYGADNLSLELATGIGGGTGTEPIYTNLFTVFGFGRFEATPQGGVTPTPVGTYMPPSTVELIDGVENTQFAFLARTGNSTTPNANHLVYKTIKINGAAEPFKYTVTTHQTTGGQIAYTYSLKNCQFYWRGQLVTLADYVNIPANGSLYLNGYQTAPTASSPDPEWMFNIETAAPQAFPGGKCVSYRLYDFAASKPTVDYRGAMLTPQEPGNRAQLIVTKPDGGPTVEINAAGDNAKVVISANSKTITLNTADIPSSCAGALGVHKLTVKNSEGQTAEYHIIACADIDAGEIVSGVQKITAGEGITITGTDSEPIISATGGGGGETVEVDVITDISFSYNSSTKKIVANVTKSKLKVAQSTVQPQSTVDVITIREEDVVGSSQYNSSHEFVNTKRRIGVITAEAAPTPRDTVFTATPLSGELP